MASSSTIGRTPVDEFDEGYDNDLTAAPAADLPVDPMANSTAMLGTQPDSTGEVSPEEAGPGVSFAFLSMMIQGAEGLSTQYPGFVPMEITAWLQQAIQILPQLVQQSQLQTSMPVPGMGGMGGAPMTAALGPSPGGSAPSQPSGPPARSY